ncbi:hypothetical protein AVDCRST_MAG84-3655 [uncultured Microcoleus sp.]|uniref:Uncharacterized protein n=1 Tax=uncultured Microcoleus sp. TaxID=259945 RepID=A0A6J4MQ35_9CYAN|nr:hypothetical protein AVDCRST_MAG84-3655 [uncultured Microcoleus sp.]
MLSNNKLDKFRSHCRYCAISLHKMQRLGPDTHTFRKI